MVMERGQYAELVIKGSLELVKGFLLGFREGRGDSFSYYFHHQEDIRRDTLGQYLRELVDRDNFIHLCLESSMVEPFRQAVRNAHSELGLEVASERRIIQAAFGFSFTINGREDAARVRELFEQVPAGLRLEDYRTREEEHPEARQEHSIGYAPLHEYVFEGRGRIAGDFAAVIALRRRLDRLPQGGLVVTGDMALELEEEPAEVRARQRR